MFLMKYCEVYTAPLQSENVTSLSLYGNRGMLWCLKTSYTIGLAPAMVLNSAFVMIRVSVWWFSAWVLFFLCLLLVGGAKGIHLFFPCTIHRRQSRRRYLHQLSCLLTASSSAGGNLPFLSLVAHVFVCGPTLISLYLHFTPQNWFNSTTTQSSGCWSLL